MIAAFKRDDIRWLNMLLACGLVSINLVAFGAAYWLATRDIMSEFTGEVRIGSNGAARPRGIRGAGSNRSHKRSSLSKRSDAVAIEEASNMFLPLPLPLPRLNSSKPSVSTPASTLRAARRLADSPMASPNTAPLPEQQESQDEPRPSRDASGSVEAGPGSQSP
jgi:hypothetical protein